MNFQFQRAKQSQNNKMSMKADCFLFLDDDDVKKGVSYTTKI